MAEIEIEDPVEQGLPAFVFTAQALFLDDVEADDTEIADVVGNQARYVVVADQQQVDRHVLAEAEQLVLTLGELEAATLEQVQFRFYELAVHNTRDAPPEGSLASIALTWVDDSQERHVNLGYPVLELPSDTSVSAIEFKNLADYRMRFRSVVFVNQRAVAPQDPPDSPLVKQGSERVLSSEARASLEELGDRGGRAR